MDKFVFLKGGKPEAPSTQSVDAVASKSNEKGSKTSSVKTRSYHSSYLKFGFTTAKHDSTLPVCVVCEAQLANSCMKPSMLLRHLTTKHSNLVGKPLEYFERRKEEYQRKVQVFTGTYSSSEAALEVSYELSLLTARAQAPHTAVETIAIPSAKLIAEKMLDKPKKMLDAIRAIPCSDNTVSRRIQDMATDIRKQIVEHVTMNKKFSIQLDESTDVANCAQLIVYIRFFSNAGIMENILACRSLEGRTTGKDIFNTLNELIVTECGFSWDWCVSVSTDGAAAMTGKKVGLVSLIREQNPAISFNHCMIHRQALVSKNLSDSLKEALTISVEAVNFIKARALNSRLFLQLCDAMGAKHKSLLFHTEVRWLSRGKVLERLFELRLEVQTFLLERNPDIGEKFKDFEFLCRLSYLSDIFGHLNELNLKMQGYNSTVFSVKDKLRAFYSKLGYWKSCATEGQLSAFDNLQQCLLQADATISRVLRSEIQDHLDQLLLSFAKYFPDVTKDSDSHIAWVINPFSPTAVSEAALSSSLHERLLELSADTAAKLKFSDLPLEDFWTAMHSEYCDLCEVSLAYLLPFLTTYLCEKGFSALNNIRSRSRNRLQPESDLILAVSKLSPRIQLVAKEKQAQVSH